MALKQVKVSVSQDIADAFKKMCVAKNVSMASVITEFMADFSKTAANKNESKDYATRRKRRIALNAVINQLEQIKNREEQYRDNIPENLQGSVVFETAEQCISYLDEAIEILSQF